MVSKEENGVGVAEVLPADMIAVIQNQCVHQNIKFILPSFASLELEIEKFCNKNEIIKHKLRCELINKKLLMCCFVTLLAIFFSFECLRFN